MLNINHQIDSLDAQKLVSLVNMLRRGHSIKPVTHCVIQCQKFTFSLAGVNTLDSLSDMLIACDYVISFKSILP